MRKKLRSRRLQFSLRALLVVVLILATALGALRWSLKPFLRQHETRALIAQLGGTCRTKAPTSLLERIWGDGVQNIVVVELPDCDEPDAYLESLCALPYVETIVVGGEAFDGGHLAQLSKIVSLRGVALDLTGVGDDDLSAFKACRPDVWVWETERRAIRALRKVSRKLKMGWLTGTPKNKDNYLDRGHYKACVEVTMGPEVTDKEVLLLRRLKGLYRLDLSDTQVTDEGLAVLKHCPKLAILGLKNTAIGDDGLRRVSGFANLVFLDLQGTRVTDAGMEHIAKLTKLRQLYLRDTDITDAGLIHLTHIKDVISLHNTRATKSGALRLRKAVEGTVFFSSRRY